MLGEVKVKDDQRVCEEEEGEVRGWHPIISCPNGAAPDGHGLILKENMKFLSISSSDSGEQVGLRYKNKNPPGNFSSSILFRSLLFPASSSFQAADLSRVDIFGPHHNSFQCPKQPVYIQLTVFCLNCDAFFSFNKSSLCPNQTLRQIRQQAHNHTISVNLLIISWLMSWLLSECLVYCMLVSTKHWDTDRRCRPADSKNSQNSLDS